MAANSNPLRLQSTVFLERLSPLATVSVPLTPIPMLFQDEDDDNVQPGPLEAMISSSNARLPGCTARVAGPDKSLTGISLMMGPRWLSLLA